ncbi:MAG: Ig-like domain-containing protein [Halioglobus sp.]
MVLLKKAFLLICLATLAACGSSDSSFDNGNARLLRSISIDPAQLDIAQGEAAGLSATGRYNDGTTEDISSSVVWASSDPAVATIDIDGLVLGVAAGQSSSRATLDGVTGEGLITVSGPVAVRMQILPPVAEIPLNSTQDYSAFAVLSDGTVENVTLRSVWSLENESGIIQAYEPETIPSAQDIDDFGTAVGVEVGKDILIATFEDLESRSPVEVVAVQLKQIQIAPVDESVFVSGQVPYRVTGIYADGSNADLTKVATFSSSDILVANVSNESSSRGLAIGLSTGVTQISASVDGLQTQTRLTVTTSPGEIVRLDILAATDRIAVGERLQYTAIAVSSTGESRDVTSSSAWASSEPSIATIVTGQQGVVAFNAQAGEAQGVAPGETSISASYSGITSLSALTVTSTDIQLERITIEPVDPSLPTLVQQQFTATGLYSDGSRRDLTASVFWQTSDADIVVLSNTVEVGIGLAFTLEPGVATVSASFDDVTGSTKVTVIDEVNPDAQLVVSPPISEVAIGTVQAYIAELIIPGLPDFDVTSSVTWESTDPAVASIDASGNARALSAGETNINATLKGKGSQILRDSAVLQVKSNPVVIEELTISPPEASLAVSEAAQFVATARLSDGTTQDVSGQVTWRTDNADIALVDTSGLLTAVGAGDTLLRAKLTAEGVVFDASSRITVRGSALVGITVSPPSAITLVGASVSYVATAYFDDGTTQDVTETAGWASADETIAQVDGRGVATGRSPGFVQISASLAGANGPVVGAAGLNVEAPSPGVDQLVVEPAIADVLVGLEQAFTAKVVLANGQQHDVTADVSWSSSNRDIAEINGSGIATGIAPGVATISAILVLEDGSYSDTASFTVLAPAVEPLELIVSPPQANVVIDGSAQFTARINFSDGSSKDVTDSVGWTSSDLEVAQVAEGGLATGLAEGAASIVASLPYEGITYSGSGSLTVEALPVVIEKVRVLPATVSLYPGTTEQYTAEVLLSDGRVIDVTQDSDWTTAQPEIASISPAALLTANLAGSTEVIATFLYQGNPVSGKALVSVLPPAIVIESLLVEPKQAKVVSGQTTQYTAVAVYSDGTEADVTHVATWISSNKAVASIDSAGIALGIAGGKASIEARHEGLSDTGTLTVEDSSIFKDLRIEPSSAEVLVDTTQQYQAIATFSDNSELNVTNDVSWSVAPDFVAHVTDAGLATGLSAGSAQISATFIGDGIDATATAVLDVLPIPVVVDRLEISPQETSLLPGESQQYSAKAFLSNGEIDDVTPDVDWQSLTAEVAQIGNTGLAVALVPGETTISGVLRYGDGLTASDEATLTVEPIALVRIEVQPANASLPLGRDQQYTAIGIFNNGQQSELVEGVIWSSSDGSIAAIDPAGVVTTKAEGTAKISATSQGVSGSTNVTVTDKVIDDLQIYPALVDDPSGTIGTLVAEAHYSDQSKDDVTKLATWSSEDTSVVTVSDASLFKGAYVLFAPGESTVTASFEGLTDTIPVTVGDAELRRIIITPLNPTEPAGLTVQFIAKGVYSDLRFADLTDDVVWRSSQESVVIFKDQPGEAVGLKAGTSNISASLSGINGQTTFTVTAPAPTELTVTPPIIEGPTGTSAQLMATMTYTDATQRDVTEDAQWVSSNAGIATVGNGEPDGSPSGQVMLVGVGSTSVTASFAGLDGSAQVKANAPVAIDLFVEPYGETYPDGLLVEFSAIATFDNGSSEDVTADAVWHSLNGDVIQAVPGSPGRFYTVAEGEADVTATFESIVEDAPVTVRPARVTALQITPGSVSAAAGALIQLEATAFYDNLTSEFVTDQAVWQSEDESVAVVSATGETAGTLLLVAPGSTSVSADFAGVKQSIPVEVLPATLEQVVVQPFDVQLPLGNSQQFEAVGIYSDLSSAPLPDATWTSSNDSIATIDASGEAFSIATGGTEITAEFGGKKGVTPLTVVEASLTELRIEPSVNTGAVGTSSPISAAALYSDGRTVDVSGDVTWGSESGFVATVSYGESTGADLSYNNEGITRVSATLGSGDSAAIAYADVTTTSAILESIVLDPDPLPVATGGFGLIVATGLFSDGTAETLNVDADWTVADPSVATVSQDGIVQGLFLGASTMVTASVDTASGTISGTGLVEVVEAELLAIQITPAKLIEPAGTSGKLTATGFYSNLSSADITKSVTWVSGDQNIASVTSGGSDAGVLQLNNPGSTSVKASLEGVEDQISVEVTSAELVSITVTPGTAQIPAGKTGSFSATGNFSDGTSTPINEDVSWTSSDVAIAEIDSTGFATANSPGSVVITATSGDVSGTASLTVTSAVLESLQITPAGLTEPAGTSGQFAATATLSDGSNQDFTQESSWSSSDSSIVSVANEPTPGLASLKAPGEALITAQVGEVSDSVTVIVTSAVLEDIRVTPATSSVSEGVEVQYSAEGIYSDGSVTPINEDVSWSSSSTAIATITQTGLADAISQGAVTIQAVVPSTPGVVGTASLTVTDAVIEELRITPQVPQTLLVGQTQSYTAAVFYTDGQSFDVTAQSNWSVQPESIAAPTQDVGTFKALAPGQGAVTAEYTATAAGKGASGRSITSDSVALTVDPAVVVSVEINTFRESGQPVSIPAGRSENWQAFANFSDGSFTEITNDAGWSSSSTSVATVVSGNVAAIASGNADISIAYCPPTNALGGNNCSTPLTDSVALTVTDAELVSLTVSPSSATISVGTSASYTAIGAYSDGSSENVTRDASWATGDRLIADITGTGDTVQVKGFSEGQTSVTATLSGASASGTVIVDGALPTSLLIQPVAPALTVDSTWLYSAIATYADNSTQDVTDASNWQSDNPGVAVVSNDGIAETIAVGASEVSATYEALVATTLLEVVACESTDPNGKPESVFLIPENPSLAEIGATVQMQAIGIFVFNDVGDECETSLTIDPQTQWKVTGQNGSNKVIEVNAAGLVTGITCGAAVVEADYRGVKGETGVTVCP